MSLGTESSQQPDPVSPPWCPIRAVVVLLVLLCCPAGWTARVSSKTQEEDCKHGQRYGATLPELNNLTERDSLL